MLNTSNRTPQAEPVIETPEGVKNHEHGMRAVWESMQGRMHAMAAAIREKMIGFGQQVHEMRNSVRGALHRDQIVETQNFASPDVVGTRLGASEEPLKTVKNPLDRKEFSLPPLDKEGFGGDLEKPKTAKGAESAEAAHETDADIVDMDIIVETRDLASETENAREEGNEVRAEQVKRLAIAAGVAGAVMLVPTIATAAGLTETLIEGMIKLAIKAGIPVAGTGINALLSLVEQGFNAIKGYVVELPWYLQAALIGNAGLLFAHTDIRDKLKYLSPYGIVAGLNKIPVARWLTLAVVFRWLLNLVDHAHIKKISVNDYLFGLPIGSPVASLIVLKVSQTILGTLGTVGYTALGAYGLWTTILFLGVLLGIPEEKIKKLGGKGIGFIKGNIPGLRSAEEEEPEEGAEEGEEATEGEETSEEGKGEGEVEGAPAGQTTTGDTGAGQAGETRSATPETPQGRKTWWDDMDI